MKSFAPPVAAPALPLSKAGAMVDNRPAAVAQRQLQAAISDSPRQAAAAQLAAPRPNATGLPNQLKAGVESLSGHSLDDVRVHYNSSKPAQLQALAYAQGTDIHLGPGQEKHLPHEAWHVVQQKQGRVRATRQLKGVAVNDDTALEREADQMGKKATQLKRQSVIVPDRIGQPAQLSSKVIQRAIGYEVELGGISITPNNALHKGMVLWRGSGWDASVDELGAGFDLEFRTSPVDDLSAGGRSKVISRLTAIQRAWARIENATAPQPARAYSSQASASIIINGRGGPHNAQIQASAGLSLDALREIRSGNALNTFAALPSSAQHGGYVRTGGQLDSPVHAVITARLSRIRTALGLPRTENIDNLAAVIGLIVDLPITSYRTNGPYTKALAGGLMARTNFATIIKQLPPNQVRAIRTHATQWKNVLFELVRAGIATSEFRHPQNPDLPIPINHRTPLFRPGSSPNARNFGSRLSMRNFFFDLAGGTDRATRADYAARHPDHQAEADELESLGSYGTQMDAGHYEINYGAVMETVAGLSAITLSAISSLGGYALGMGGLAVAGHGARKVSRAVRNRPIFEFRALGSPDNQDLVHAGLALWDYVEAAHGRQPGGANALSRGARIWNRMGS